MRIAVAPALAALVAVLPGCQLDRKSPGYACQVPEDCDADRTCVNGWCVDNGSPADADPTLPDADPTLPDADPAAPDAFACPAACNSCDIDNWCILTCDGADSCPTPVVCPAGVKCKVECNGIGSCAGGIDCSAASSCRIECTQQDSCAGLISCGEGFCRVECMGPSSCTGGIDCDTSCACDTLCDGTGSCTIAPLCPGPPQCQGGPCSSLQGQCNSC